MNRFRTGNTATENALFTIIKSDDVPYGNYILDTLPEDVRGTLRPALQRVFLQRRDDAGDSRWSRALLFPTDALLRASLNGANGGRPVTLVAMGRRSVIGMNRWLGCAALTDFHVLEAGHAWTLPLDDLPERNGALGQSLAWWQYRLLVVTAYRLSCQSEHNVDRRLAQALLWIADETGRPEIYLTHKALSELTAMRRPSVSLVLSALQRRGVVRTANGSIAILNRRRLEDEACECYQSTRAIMFDLPHIAGLAEPSNN